MKYTLILFIILQQVLSLITAAFKIMYTRDLDHAKATIDACINGAIVAIVIMYFLYTNYNAFIANFLVLKVKINGNKQKYHKIQ